MSTYFCLDFHVFDEAPAKKKNELKVCKGEKLLHRCDVSAKFEALATTKHNTTKHYRDENEAEIRSNDPQLGHSSIGNLSSGISSNPFT